MTDLPKHTPGPWIAECFSVRQATGKQLEVCHTGIIGRNKPGEQAEADAALIARAPELLDDNARLRELLRDASKACETLLMLSLPQDIYGMAMLKIARNTNDRIKAELEREASQ